MEAIRLRSTEGLTLDELAERLGASRTTVYYWIKSIPKGSSSANIAFQRSERQRAAQLAAAAANQAKCAARRQEAYDRMREKAGEMLRDPQVRDFVVLYLAEGYRKQRNSVAMSNSNPHIVKFAHEAMRRLATNQHFYYSFQFHADQNPTELRCFWGAHLDVDPNLIHPIPKTNSGHLAGRRFACEYGIFQVQASDTRFRAELQALMDAIQEEWAAR